MTEPIEPAPESDNADSELDDTAIDEAADDEPIRDMAAVKRLRQEAQRLRHLLREEQANRQSEQASALARIAEYEKREIEQAAAQVLIDPQDVMRYTSAEEQAAFNDEFGAIVADTVVEAAKRLAAQRPHLAKTQRPPTDRPLEGLRGGASPEQQARPITWAQALRGTGA